MSACLIYITASSAAEATELGRKLVNNRLVACANVLGPITSVFFWQGEAREEGEVAMVAKTQDDLVEHIVSWVKEWHSYDCPCVITLPINDGNPEFLEWIAEETANAVT